MPPITSTTTSGCDASASSTLCVQRTESATQWHALPGHVAVEDVRQLNAVGELRAIGQNPGDRSADGAEPEERHPQRTARHGAVSGGDVEAGLRCAGHLVSALSACARSEPLRSLRRVSECGHDARLRHPARQASTSDLSL